MSDNKNINEINLDKKPNLLYVKDKKTGNTYVYEDRPFWDKEKKYSRSKRKMIGKLDPNTNEIIPNRKYGDKNPDYVKRNNDRKNTNKKELECTQYTVEDFRGDYKRKEYGTFLVFDSIAKDLNFYEMLSDIFPNNYKEYASLGLFSILSEKNGMYMFEHFDKNSMHTCNHNISSQDISMLLADINENHLNKLFEKLKSFSHKDEYLAYDSTSITRYSDKSKLAAYGFNKEHDLEKQINLLFVVGEKSRLPLYFRIIKGNIADVVTVRVLVNELNILGYENANLVMDRGFVSIENIVGMINGGYNFIIGAKFNANYILNNLYKNYDKLIGPESILDGECEHGTCITIKAKQISNSIENEKQNIYIYYYIDLVKQAELKHKFHDNLSKLKEKALNGKLSLTEKNRFEKFYKEKGSGNNKKYVLNEDVYEKTIMRLGVFAFISNKKMTPYRALEIYRTKDVVEKKFYTYKEDSNGRRLFVNGDKTTLGRCFISFLGLFLFSEYQNRVRNSDLLEKYKSYDDIIEILKDIHIHIPGNKKPFIGEITRKQKEILSKIGVSLPVL